MILRSAIRTQSDAWYKMSTGGLLLRGTFPPFFSIELFHVGNKRSHILKHTCSFQTKVCLSIFVLLLPHGQKSVKILDKELIFSAANWEPDTLKLMYSQILFQDFAWIIRTLLYLTPLNGWFRGYESIQLASTCSK